MPTTMRHDSATVALIECIAQDQLRYELIFTKQAEILRTDQPRFDAALAKFQQSPLLAQPGQRWEPTGDSVEEYLSRCNDICLIVPQDFDDRVKIAHAAHAALMCLATCKFSKQPDSVQLAILGRHNELSLSLDPTPPFTNDLELSPSEPSVKQRILTAKERRLFQNPDKLHGKKFVLSPNTKDAGIFEVIGYHRKRDKSVQYDVLFDDCDGPILLEEGEMMNTLEDSLYIPH